jgi:hypothetical protein
MRRPQGRRFFLWSRTASSKLRAIVGDDQRIPVVPRGLDDGRTSMPPASCEHGRRTFQVWKVCQEVWAWPEAADND